MFIWYIKFYYVNRTKMNGVLVKNLFPRSLHFLFIVVYHECHNVWLKVMYFSFFFFSSRTTQIAISAFLDTFQKVADMATGSRGNWYLIYLFLLFFIYILKSPLKTLVSFWNMIEFWKVLSLAPFLKSDQKPKHQFIYWILYFRLTQVF